MKLPAHAEISNMVDPTPQEMPCEASGTFLNSAKESFIDCACLVQPGVPSAG